MYFLKPEENLPLEQIIADFQTMHLPKMKRWQNYYAGKQDILLKTATDESKPCNKVVVNYCNNIVKTYNGYLTGQPITYSSDVDINDILDVLNYNDSPAADSELLKNALIAGWGYELHYIDVDGKIRYCPMNSLECIPVYTASVDKELLYVIRYWSERDYGRNITNYFVDVYSAADVKHYSATPNWTTTTFLGSENHLFGMVPFTVLEMPDHEAIFAQIMGLQDMYNNLMSGQGDAWDAFADCYLVLKGMNADADDLAAMKEHRILLMDNDADAAYLTKDMSNTGIDSMLKNVNDLIYTKSNTPDFNDEKFLAQSGIALRYKLVGFSNATANIEQQMKKTLQRRIELISQILHLTSEAVWRDIDITFTYNLPTSMADIATELNQFRGLVSDRTLLGQIPFVKDVDAELEQLARDREAAAKLYEFEQPEYYDEQ